MYYKLRMQDRRVVFVPAKEIHETINATFKDHDKEMIASSFTARRKQIRERTQYVDCVDWELVEDGDILGYASDEDMDAMHDAIDEAFGK